MLLPERSDSEVSFLDDTLDGLIDALDPVEAFAVFDRQQTDYFAVLPPTKALMRVGLKLTSWPTLYL